MIDSIISRVNLFISRRKWRKDNSDNYTFMNEKFNPQLVSVGKGSYGSLHVVNFSDCYKLKIGNYCSIAGNVYFIVCGEHRIDTISTYPYRAHYLGHKFEATSKGDIAVDDDVWLGENVTVLSGVHIGQGAVIAAGSIVTKDVPPYAVVGGNPARVIKYRFSNEIIEELQKVDFSSLNVEMMRKYEKELYEELTDVRQLAWLPRKSGTEFTHG